MVPMVFYLATIGLDGFAMVGKQSTLLQNKAKRRRLNALDLIPYTWRRSPVVKYQSLLRQLISVVLNFGK